MNNVTKIGKYNEKTKTTVLESLRSGNTRTTSCHLANIGVSTFYEWLTDKPEFKLAVEKAEADSVAELVAMIKVQGPKDWRAALALLERRSEEWNKQDKVDVTSKDEKIEFTVCIKRPAGNEDTEI